MHLFGLPGKILKTAFPAVVFLACISLPAFCQKEKTDSLFRLVQNHPGDRQLRKDFNAAFRKWNADSALKFSMQQVKLAQDSVTKGDWLMYSGVLIDQLNQPVKAEKFYRESYNTLLAAGDTFNLDDCSNSLGYVLARLGKYKDSKKYLDQALALRDASKDTLGMTGTLLNLGFLYSDMEDDTRGLDCYFKALGFARKFEKTDPTYCGKLLNNIGAIYHAQKKSDDALSFFRQALYYKLKAGIKSDLASTYNNIGSVYSEEKQNDSALYYFQLALKIREETKDLRGQSIVHNNLGDTYTNLSQFDKANENYQLSFNLRKQLRDRKGMAQSLQSLGDMELERKNFHAAISYLQQAYDTSTAIGDPVLRLQASISLAKAFKNNGDNSDALTYSLLALDLKDSVTKAQNDKHSEEMKARYDMDRQARELDDLKAQQEKQKIIDHEKEVENDAQQSRYKLIGIAGAVVVLLIGIFFFLRFREKQKSEAALRVVNEQIEAKNKSITDSIHYAKRIQQAILPGENLLRQAFPGSFALYKPKDIVSGDFYWLHQDGERIILAVADCTGHGVPGAFMSVMGASQLTATVTENPGISPSEILRSIDEGIRSQLHQDIASSESRDGMDVALCVWKPATRELIFAGANRPLLLYRTSGVFEIIKSDKTSVGGIYRNQAAKFNEFTINLDHGDVFYLFSDGFVDQFGGPKGKKFKSRQFRDVIAQVAALDIQQQKNEIEKVFEQWRGGLEQVDDVCVIGIRV